MCITGEAFRLVYFLKFKCAISLCIQEAIVCLASVIGSNHIKYFFVSSLKKCESSDDMIKSGEMEDKIQEDDTTAGVHRMSKHTRCKTKRYSSSVILMSLHMLSSLLAC